MDALVHRPAGGFSLLDRGYRYVNLDDGIVLKSRDARGALVVDSQRFPKGLAFLSKEAHSRGLLFGVYTARGPRTCCGKAGSLGHEKIDAQTYANDWQIVSEIKLVLGTRHLLRFLSISKSQLDFTSGTRTI